MKLIVRFPLVLTAALILSATARAEDLASSENPYATLVTRNVFGLVPIPTNPPVDPTPVDPPPKITFNGLMNILGKEQVLFKTPGKVKAGQPPKEESYMLGVGERQDDIEVKKIDEQANVVTFENHGVIQELPLSVAAITGSPGPGPGAPGGPGMPPTLGTPGGPPGTPGSFGGARFGRAARANRNVTQSADLQQAQGGPSGFGAANLGGVNLNGQNNEGLSPEAQVLLIEKNRMDTQSLVDQGKLPPLPPTVLTPADATAHDGSPLIAPNETVPTTPQR